MSGPNWILQKELPKARRSRQNVLRNMSSSLWRGIKWDQAPLLIRRTQRKGMKWHQAPLLIRRTQRKEMQQRIMKEVYMCCSKFLFQLILMSPLFEINYHHYHTQKQWKKNNFNICLQSVNGSQRIERFHMTTRWRYSVLKNNETAASCGSKCIWCVNASFSPMNLHKFWPHWWKR